VVPDKDIAEPAGALDDEQRRPRAKRIHGLRAGEAVDEEVLALHEPAVPRGRHRRVRFEIEAPERGLQVEFAAAPPVEEPVGRVRRLLQLEEEKAASDGVHGPRGHEDCRQGRCLHEPE
jgi:hypothetical protein